MELSGYSYNFDRLLTDGEMDTAATIRFHRELGVLATEVADRYVLEDQLPLIEAALAETGGRIVVYDATCDFVRADGSAPPEQVARARTAVERAARLGAPRVLVVPGEIEPAAEPALVRRHYGEVVGLCQQSAARHGIEVMIANLGLAAAYCGTTAHQAEVFGQVGADLRATYDVGNYMMAGEDPIAALDRVAPRLAHVHFKDWRIFPPGAEVEGAFEAIDGRQFLAVVLGTGVVDLPAALARLRQLDYDGSITVEYEGPDDPREAVAGSVAYMRRLLEAPT